MLQPKRTKFRKQFKGRNRGLALVGNNVVLFGGHTGTEFSRSVTQVRLAAPTLRRLAARWLLTYHPAVLEAAGMFGDDVPVSSDTQSDPETFVAT